MNESTRKTVMTYITDNKIGNFLPVLDWLEEHNDVKAGIYGGERNREGERKILNVEWIEVQGIKGAKDLRTMMIKPGVTLLYGPNDSGKSTFLAALVFALSKRTYGGSSSPEDLITRGLEKGMVQVCLDGDGVSDHDCIKRTVASHVVKKGKKVGSTETVYDLDVTLGGAKSTSAADAETNLGLYLGQPFDTLRRCFLVAQGQLDALLDEQSGKRQDLFFRMLALEPCEATRKQVSDILKKAEEDLGHQLTRAMEYKLEIASDKRKLDELGDMEVASKRLKELDKKLKGREAYDARSNEVIEKKRAQGERLELLKKNWQFCQDLEKKKDSLDVMQDGDWEGEAEIPRELATRVSDLSDLAAQLKAKRDLIKEQGTALKTLPLECPTCATMGKKCEITAEMRAERRASLLAEYKAIDAAIDHNAPLYDKAYQELQEAQEKVRVYERGQAAFANLEQSIAGLDAEIARVNVTWAMVQKAQAEYDQPDSIPRPDDDDEDAFGEAQLLRQKLDEAVRLASNVKEKKEKLKAAEEASGDEGQRWLTSLRAVLFAFQKDGIPLWIVNQHLEEINDYARELCEDDRYAYTFNDDLSISIIDCDDAGDAVTSTAGIPIHPGLASGSSRQRAALVLQAALARWQCRMNGVQPQLFWIDELPFQDAEHAAMCVGLIKRLTQWFPKVVVAASHWEGYAGKFDHEVALLGKPIRKEIPTVKPHECVFTRGGDICCAMGHAEFDATRRAGIPSVPTMTQAEVEAEVEAATKPGVPVYSKPPPLPPAVQKDLNAVENPPTDKPKRTRRTKAEMAAAIEADRAAVRAAGKKVTPAPDRDENSMGSNAADYNDDPHWSATGGHAVDDDEPF